MLTTSKSALIDYALSLRDSSNNRAFTVGASDIGQCSRKVWFAKHGAERDPGRVDTWGATLRGQMIEQHFWAPALRARFGTSLKFIGDRQRQFKRGFISATPDALLTNAPRDILAPLGVADIGADCLLLEAKSVDPRVKLDAPKPEHRYQAIVQLGVVRDTTEYQPNFVLLTYIDASFWDLTTEFVVGFDPEVYANAKVRATKVLTANAASELPPEGWISGGKDVSTVHSPASAVSSGAPSRTAAVRSIHSSPPKCANSPSPIRHVRPTSTRPRRHCAQANRNQRTAARQAAAPRRRQRLLRDLDPGEGSTEFRCQSAERGRGCRRHWRQ